MRDAAGEEAPLRGPWVFVAVFGLAAVCAVLGIPGMAFASGQTNGSASIPGQVIVGFASGDDRASVRHKVSDLGFEPAAHLSRDLKLLSLPDGISVKNGASMLARVPGIDYAVPNYVDELAARPDDWLFENQWALDSEASNANIRAPAAWDVTTGSADVTVAVADNGVDPTHADLVPNLLDSGYDFVDGDNNPTDPGSFANSGHGTHVSGIVGASGNNGLGVTGVAWRVGLMPLRVCGAGCTHADVIAAITYAANHGARVFNGSFVGAGAYSPAMRDAISSASSMLFVFAAGNDRIDVDASPVYPCAYPTENILCVAASDQSDRLADFSNYGASTVDLAAPGVGILSTVPGSDYGYETGTSSAAPQVAGAAALLLSHNPGLASAEARAQILGGVEPVPDLRGKVASSGRLDVGSVLAEGARGGLRLTRTPKKKSKSRTARFEFGSDEPGAMFECAIDRKPLKSCSSPKKLSSLNSRRHKFRLLATDSTEQTTFRWRVVG
jgi:subtilisin family serine protease